MVAPCLLQVVLNASLEHTPVSSIRSHHKHSMQPCNAASTTHRGDVNIPAIPHLPAHSERHLARITWQSLHAMHLHDQTVTGIEPGSGGSQLT